MAMHHFKSPAVLTEYEQRVSKAAVYDTTNYPDKLEQKKTKLSSSLLHWF